MKREITEYITNIRKGKTYSRDYCKEVDEWYFTGDGMGDFEETSYDAREEIVRNYIAECYNQIEIAKEYLVKRDTAFKWGTE